MFKKILSIIIIIILSNNLICLADDKLETNNTNITKIIETSSNISESPIINSRSAVVIDRKSKAILYGKNENIKKAMASTTKIMTAMVVIQNTNLDNIVEISKKSAGTGGSRLGLKKGDKITVKDLLYGLLLRSGNDSAVALAEYVGGSIEEFAKLMNENAGMLELKNTQFVTPHGLDKKEHYTTAYELALLADYALNNQIFSQIVNTKTYTITINGNSKTINNTNELLGNLYGVYGVKTGFTNGAGRCLVTSVKRNDLDIICVVLGADTKKDRTKDSVKLIEYTYKKYEPINLNEEIEENFEKWNEINKNRININKGASNRLELYLDKAEKDIIYPIIKGTNNKIEITISANLNLKAPIEKDCTIGELLVTYNNEIIKKINIKNHNAVNKKRIGNYIEEFMKDYNMYLQRIIR